MVQHGRGEYGLNRTMAKWSLLSLPFLGQQRTQ
jgi:hypothetical protein